MGICDNYSEWVERDKNTFLSPDNIFTDAELNQIVPIHENDVTEDFIEEDKRIEAEMERTMTNILHHKNYIPPSLEVDDGDIPLFPNFFKFVSDKHGLATDIFAKQAAIGTVLLGEWCPRCAARPELLYDVQGLMPVDYNISDFEEEFALLHYGECKKCYATRAELMAEQSRELIFYNRLALVAGQRSGKSALAHQLLAYYTHRVLKMGNPMALYGVLKYAALTITMTALTFATAKAHLYNGYLEFIKESPWFKAYHELLDYEGQKASKELYSIQAFSTHYRHRKLFCPCI